MRIQCSLRIVAFAAPAVLAAAPNVARGQGFGLNDIGSCAVARAYATTGAPCRDASTIYWNPGAAATLPGLSVYLGGDIIGVNGGFTADSTLHHTAAKVPTLLVPSVFVNYGMHLGARRVSVGVGVYVPYGLTSQWPTSFPGRFEAQTASLRTIYFQPNLAIEIIPGVLSIGGGPVIGHSDVVLRPGTRSLGRAGTGRVRRHVRPVRCPGGNGVRTREAQRLGDSVRLQRRRIAAAGSRFPDRRAFPLRPGLSL